MVKRYLNDLDADFESQLAKIAGYSIETKARQAESMQAEAVKIHYARPEVGIFLPAGQAMLTGVLTGLAVGAIVYLLGWSKPLVWGLITWLVVQVITWLFLLKDWRSVVLRKLETLTGLELDGNPGIGESAEDDDEPITTTIRIELSENDGRHVRYVDLPGTEEQITKLAVGLSSGTTLSESNWIGPGRPFQRAQFTEIRSELIRRGLAAWNSPGTPARGCSLTAAGRACFKRMAEELSPTPSEY